MKQENKKANNLRLGSIYVNATTSQPMRLVANIPCEGVWLASYDGQGYGDLVQFEDVHYANSDEVQDYLEDSRAYNNKKIL